MVLKIILSLFVLLLMLSHVILIKGIRAAKKREENLQRYLADTAHELKTPLSAMKVLADSLLSMEHAGEDVYREFMRDISFEVDRENKIIGDLMTLAGMEKRRLQMNISTVSVNEVLENIVRMLMPLAVERNVTVYYTGTDLVEVSTDKGKLSDIVMNLVENAIKYNVEGGWVKVSLDREPEKCCIRVSDSGIGIAESEKERVFERFYRADKQHSREIGGTGLGLSIVSEAVSLLGGTIELESRIGRGSTFTVKIPLSYSMRRNH